MGRWRALLSGLLLAGCGISSDPVIGDVDGSFGQAGTKDAGAPGGGIDGPRFSEIEDYQGCDVDLTCSMDCVAPDSDPDCPINGVLPVPDGGVPPPRRPPAADGLQALGEEVTSVTLEPNADAWWVLGQSDAPLVAWAVVDAGDATLAAFDAEGRLLARALPGGEVLALRVRPAEGEPKQVLVRCLAGEPGATVELRRAPAEPPVEP